MTGRGGRGDEGLTGCQMGRRCRLKVGVARRRPRCRPRLLTHPGASAGSALIQACEKAGVTVPRCVLPPALHCHGGPGMPPAGQQKLTRTRGRYCYHECEAAVPLAPRPAPPPHSRRRLTSRPGSS